MKKYVPLVMVASLLFAPSIGSAALSDDLEAVWKFEETSGTRYDETDNNNDLTDNNTVSYTSSGMDGNAAYFTLANSEYFTLSDGSQTGLDFDTSDAFTISAWFYGLSNNNMTLYSKAWPSGVYAFYGARVYPVSNIISGYMYDGSINQDFGGSVTINASTWYHYVWAYDVASTSKMYINGTLMQESSPSHGSLSDISDNITIGVRNHRTTGTLYDYMNGYIDEMYIYSRMLEQDEVLELYNEGDGTFYPFSTSTATTTEETSTTTTTSIDVSELTWMIEMYLSWFTFLLMTLIGYKVTKFVI